MPIFRERPSGQGSTMDEGAFAGSKDPRFSPTPDYGTLGPDSDFAKNTREFPSAASPNLPASSDVPRPAAKVRLLSALAMGMGILAALIGAVAGGPQGLANRILGPARQGSRSAGNISARSLNGETAQQQAETLLTRAVSHSPGATEEIHARVDAWRGQLSLDPELSQLTTAALNSDAPSVRGSGIEVQLAAYGLDKRVATVDGLLHRADSSDHAQRVWALWSLGLLGNRGVESDRIVEALTAHLEGVNRDADEDSRRWAVEGLALVGTDATIPPLLRALRDDPSPSVRERAACSLAESGMLTHAQRMTAVPQLIDYSEDRSLDAQTRAWVFQALSDITRQRLPNDPAAWRKWYQSSAGANR